MTWSCRTELIEGAEDTGGFAVAKLARKGQSSHGGVCLPWGLHKLTHNFQTHQKQKTGSLLLKIRYLCAETTPIPCAGTGTSPEEKDVGSGLH